MLRFDLPTARLRSAAILEGISYLLLLFVAMPLKYLADQPLPVRITGSIHGALFVWLGILTLGAMRSRGKGLGWGIRVGVASLIPFGTFALDRDLRTDDRAARRG
ncbi:MAG: integral membrane protein [Chlamydiales bacterium]|jgi:integral membrane protein